MERRDILKFAAIATGTALCAPLTQSALAQQLATPIDTSKGPQFFDSKNFTYLTAIMDVILPVTDSPSASQVQVNYIMDNMFAKVFDPEYQQQFLQKFGALVMHLESQQFLAATAEARQQMIEQVEGRASIDKDAIFRVYIDIKQQTVSYFLATEEIAENHLNYLPIPGEYIPSISLKEVGGKIWAE